MRMMRVLAVGLCLTFGAVMLPGCEKQGPAERAGKKIDDAGQAVKDKVDPPGPAEKAGRKIDRAVGGDSD